MFPIKHDGMMEFNTSLSAVPVEDCAVELDTSDTTDEPVVKLADGTGVSIGTCVYPPKSAGDPCSVNLFGNVFTVVSNGASAAIAKGDHLKTTTAGVQIKSAADKDNYNGIALNPSTANGKKIMMLVMPGSLSHA